MLSFWGVKPEIVKFIHPEFFEDKFSLHETFFIHQSHKKVPYWSKSSSFRIHKTNPCSTKSENILVRWTRRDDRFFPQINGPQKTTGFAWSYVTQLETSELVQPTGPETSRHHLFGPSCRKERPQSEPTSSERRIKSAGHGSHHRSRIHGTWCWYIYLAIPCDLFKIGCDPLKG